MLDFRCYFFFYMYFLSQESRAFFSVASREDAVSPAPKDMLSLKSSNWKGKKLQRFNFTLISIRESKYVTAYCFGTHGESPEMTEINFCRESIICHNFSPFFPLILINLLRRKGPQRRKFPGKHIWRIFFFLKSLCFVNW